MQQPGPASGGASMMTDVAAEDGVVGWPDRRRSLCVSGARSVVLDGGVACGTGWRRGIWRALCSMWSVSWTRAVLHRRPGGCSGRPPYEPEMMFALVALRVLLRDPFGAGGSRRTCRTDAAFRVICGGLVPDHATIARFVVDHERALEGLFVEGVRLCAAAGLAESVGRRAGRDEDRRGRVAGAQS